MRGKKTLVYPEVSGCVNSRVVDDLELWTYVSAHGRSNANVRIIYGIKDVFKIITSKHVVHCDVSLDVGYTCKENSGLLVAMERAIWIMEDFDRFLDRAVGNHDKRSVEYKRFIEKREDFKVYVMKTKVEGKHE